MPQVPTYDGPQVRTQALQPVFQRTPDVSSGAQALAKAVGQVTDELDRKIQRDAQDEAFKLELQIRTDWQKQRAALREQYKGDLADQYKAAADEWWKKAPETYGKAASPMARQMATRSIGQYMLQSEADTLGYVEGEKRKSREVNFRTLQDSIVREAGQIVTVDNARQIAARDAQRIYNNAIEHAAKEGYNSDVGKAMAREQLDRFHADMALALATKPGGAQAAQAYMAEFGKDMPLAVRTRVDEVVNREADNQFATQFAAGVATKPLAEQLSEAAKIENPDRREKAITQIRNNYALVKAAQAEREQAVKDQAWQLVGQGKKVPEALLAQMDGRGRVELQDYLKTRAKQAAEGTPVKTDWATYIDLRTRLAAGEKINLTQYTTKLAGKEIEQLLDLQTKVGTPGSVKQDSMMTDQQRIEAMLVGLGIDPKKRPEEAGRLTALIDQRVRAESAAKGNKDLTADEKQKIIDRVALDKVYVDEWGRDPQKPVALLTPEEMTSAYVRVNGKNVQVSSVPRADREQIIAALRATNQPATEQAIVEMYLRGKNPRASSGTVKP